jgi:hypothetical protein
MPAGEDGVCALAALAGIVTRAGSAMRAAAMAH